VPCALSPTPSTTLQASSERNEIEREMNKLLFERTVASQEAVLHTLTDEMSKWVHDGEAVAVVVAGVVAGVLLAALQHVGASAGCCKGQLATGSAPRC